MFGVINTLVLLILLIGIVFLQIFLSKKRNKWLGLILPIICLMFSILVVVQIPAYTITSVSYQTTDESGNVIEQGENQVSTAVLPDIAMQIISIFVLYNIPTVILMGIYIGCREKQKKNQELEKMNIQDLE